MAWLSSLARLLVLCALSLAHSLREVSLLGIRTGERTSGLKVPLAGEIA